MTATISPAELDRLRLAGPVEILDVRTPSEYAAARIPGSRNLPLDRLDAQAFVGRSAPLYVICQGGVRSRSACERLAAAGIAAVIDVPGGMSAWQSAGLPVEGSGRTAFGVERQVRCIIGGGVVAGAVLAITLHPWWAALSGGFGAGLFIAGLTGLCPLALLVAAMPWNRGGGACRSA